MITDDELIGLEEEVQSALRSGDSSLLCRLGEGEISLVLGVGDGPDWACKRLPPFSDSTAAERYADAIGRYVDALTNRGVEVLDTNVRRVAGTNGDVVLYCVQPALAPETLAIGIARDDPERAIGLVEAIVDIVLTSVEPRVGLDAQLSNWAIIDGRPIYFDVTTPLLRRADGTTELDTDVFLASLPWVLRGAAGRFVVPSIIERYHDRRTVTLDLAANLVKEELDGLIPAVIACTSNRLQPPLTEDEIRRDRRSDARTWAALQAVRRLDRAWQRHVRRRTYPFLLPSVVSPGAR